MMNQEKNTHTLSQFLHDDKTQIRIYDMSRRVSKLSLSSFEKFEKAELPYPYPYQQTAWVGILFWNTTDKNQHNIWFIRFPLDEQGLINIASRDEFMDMLFSRIADSIRPENQEKRCLSHALKDNPYVFKPTEENMAIFNAKSKITLALTPSHYYNDTLEYLAGNDLQNWTHLGIQGFADVAVRQHEKNINNILRNAISSIPMEPFCAICNALENEKCSQELTETLIEILYKLIQSNLPESRQRLVSALRAIASIVSEKIRNKVILKILNSDHGKDSAVLIMISAKLWETLSDSVILKLFLENLSSISNSSNQKLFDGLVEDLIFIPGNRQKILEIFRDPIRSDKLSHAIGIFLKGCE